MPTGFVEREYKVTSPIGTVLRSGTESHYFVSNRLYWLRRALENPVCERCGQAITDEDMIYIDGYGQTFCSTNCFRDWVNKGKEQ